jgi:hypothetical protein
MNINQQMMMLAEKFDQRIDEMERVVSNLDVELKEIKQIQTLILVRVDELG